MTKFETNKTYKTRSVCDHNCIISVTIAKRTAKTVTLTNDKTTDIESRGKTYRLREWNNVETFAPWGTYSMSPLIRAA